jgi:hypothetical protein
MWRDPQSGGQGCLASGQTLGFREGRSAREYPQPPLLFDRLFGYIRAEFCSGGFPGLKGGSFQKLPCVFTGQPVQSKEKGELP